MKLFLYGILLAGASFSWGCSTRPPEVPLDPPSSTWPPGILLDRPSGKHIERIIGVKDETVFSKPALSDLAKHFHRAIVSKHRTGTLWIVTSREDAELIQGVRATDELYEGWRMLWLQQYKRTFPVARVSVIKNDIRVEFRDRTGAIGKFILSEADPFIISHSGAKFEIVYLQARVPRDSPDPQKTEYFVDLRPTDDKPTPLSRGFIALLSEKLSSNLIWARLRVNTWFRGDTIPTVYPFAPGLVPPENMKDASPYESWCFPHGAAIKCDEDPSTKRTYLK